MKTEARKILSNLNDGRITVSQATEQVMYLIEQAQKEADNSALHKTDVIRWIDVNDELPICVSTGDWDGKQSEVILAETITGKKFLAQCYEGFMDGSPFFDWYQVDEVNGNDWLITETVLRWMTIPF